tara:strand:+ start:1640 stop:2095 length:456 start_codon:yes stop_codon:yes gene_type:complete
MALSLSRLIRNLANIKHEHTNENKFLKTKAKIKEMKNNVKEAQKDALAIHDYVSRADVSMGGANSSPPLMHPSSFRFMPRRLLEILAIPNPTEREAAIVQLENDLTIGLVQTNNGRYLTTKGAASSYNIGTFRSMSANIIKGLFSIKGKLK